MHAPLAPGAGKEPMISVVIAARNEETTIGKLLTTLATQDYRNFEIIVVNDDSDDETLWAVAQHQLKSIRVIHNRGRGKKAAITAGVQAGKGSIVVTTDADCVVSSQWLRAMREPFRDPQVMMAFGGVRIEGNNSFFHMLQAMEFSSLIGTGAASAALGVPTMCNGANLSFRRKVFSEVNGYDDNVNVPSGDDEFLMRKVQKRYKGGVAFVASPAAVVTTFPQANTKAFLNQRIRWASKWKYNSSRASQALAVSVMVFQAAFIANGLLLFTPQILPALFLISIKMILEAAFLLQVCRFLKTRWNWLAFFALQVIYPPYVIGIGIASFFRPFEWKRRIFRPDWGPFR